MGFRTNSWLYGLALLLSGAEISHGATPLIDHMVTASGFGAYAAVAAPGSWVEIYGSNLSATTRSWTAADFSGSTAPTSLDGVSVTVGGLAAFVSYVSPTQINIQVPDVSSSTTVAVVVTLSGASSPASQLKINTRQPGLLAPPGFQVNGKQYVVAVHLTTGGFVSNGSIPGTTAAPAAAGEILTFYGIGFGAVTPPVAAGQVANGTASLGSFGMTIGNLPATVLYAGVAPGSVGLYQFNVVVPPNLPAGDQGVQISLSGAATGLQTLFLSTGGVAAPGAPTNVTATPGDSGVTITFSPPTSVGGPVTGYTATCAGGGQTFSGSANASPIKITGLSNGVTYTCSVTASNSAGSGTASATVTVTPTAVTNSSFTLTTSAAPKGGSLPAAYTCDGTGSTLPLSWSGSPAGTQSFAVLLSTIPAPGTIKYDWVLYNIPATVTSLAKDSFLVGTTGLGDDGPGLIYDPPCSQGPGAKVYTWTLYALSGTPSFAVPASQVTGSAVASAIASLTLGSASLDLSYSRVQATATGSSANCVYVRNSTVVARSGTTSVNCDGTYAYVSSVAMTTDQTMNGITSTNLQIPTPQNFLGANGWKIPIGPVLAQSATPVASGPIGVAINGIPIFNPCVQNGNCTATNGDTKGEGQLDICNGHAGRADDYHYHAAPVCLMAEQSNTYWNTHPVGWLLDGFAVFGYNNADGSTPARDSCGGTTVAGSQIPSGYPYTYAYHVITGFPYITNNCVSGVPSPDLPNQGSKYHPLRQPPVTPFNDTNMTLTTDSTDGYQVLQFTSATPFVTTESGSDSYSNAPGTYRIRYKQLTGSALTSQLQLKQNANATACWDFQFIDSTGKTTQPEVAYCK